MTKRSLFVQNSSHYNYMLPTRIVAVTMHSFKRGNKTDDIGRNRLSVSHKSKRGTIMMRHKY